MHEWLEIIGRAFGPWCAWWGMPPSTRGWEHAEADRGDQGWERAR